MLTEDERKEMAKAHGRMYYAECDSCGKLIPSGALFFAVKWSARPDGLNFLSPVLDKLECVACGGAPPKESAPKNRGPLTRADKRKLEVNSAIRKAAHAIFREDTSAKLTTEEVVMRLRKRKAFRGCKKGEVAATLASMKKMRLLKRHESKWFAGRVA